jgi:hypothetical protein
MQLATSSRRVINRLESHKKRRESEKTIAFWRHNTSPKATDQSLRNHILLTRDTRYVDLAEICVFSFLYHHPNAKFKIYCDDKTITYASNKFSSEIMKSQITVELIQNSFKQDWQEQKLEIILSMNGTHDLMLDADLRWNAPLGRTEGVFFLVKEFELKDKSPFREILTKASIVSPDASMKNISIFSFGGLELTNSEIDQIRITMREYQEIVDSDVVGKLDRIAIKRVMEQYALSLCSETWSMKTTFVKKSDRPLDGGIVESCYFGATGGTF